MVVQDLETDLVSSSLKSDKKHRLKQRFDVQRKLGQGTYGKVQLAVNRETGQEVAVKTIKKIKIENEQDLIRIRREIQIMSSIQHPHIIHIYEVFENKDKIVLVMQFASGGELYDYLSEKKVLSDLEARRIFRQIAAAVYYCHKNKICHRDLKLENILLDEKGNAKIADFGLSNVFDEKHLLNTYCGSPLYASPEIVKGVPYYGPEVDCWSMGVLLYTLVYGAMPFDGSNFKKLVTQISEGDYFEPKKKSNASELIRKLLTVNPNKRATIVDICMDCWVNHGYEHSLLQVAEDMANLTPVRLDLLLALAPDSDIPQEDLEQLDAGDVTLINKNPEKEILDEEDEDEEDYNADTAANSFAFMKGSRASQLSISQPNLQEALGDEYEEESDNDFLPADLAVALQGECAKRLAESSFGSSLARISSLAHRSKKTKKSDSSNTCLSQKNEKELIDMKIVDRSPEEVDDNKEKSTNNKQAEVMEINKKVVEENKTENSHNLPVDNKEISEKQPLLNEDVKPVSRKDSLSSSKKEIINQRKESFSASEEKGESKKVGRPPGKIIIPKTFDSVQTTPSPKSNIKKPIKNESKTEVSEQNQTLPSQSPSDNTKNNVEKSPIEDINKNIVTNVSKEESCSPVISEDKKNIAKDILKKGIAKAKLAERRMSKQSSIDSDVSSCSTSVSCATVSEAMPSFFKTPKPYSREEETNVTSKAEIKLSSPQTSCSTLKDEAQKIAPLWNNAGCPSERNLPDKNINWSAISSTIDSEMSGWREQMEESLRRLSPDDERLSKDSYALTRIDDDKPLVPIARSYKKFTFTKDGACITETKKIYTTPGADGSWTKVEKKTKITTRPGNAEEFEKFRDLHLRTDSPITRSDSQSSSGSNDVYDDIFDSWTGDTMMCNMRKMNNMFQKFSRDPFLRKERRRNPFRFFRRTESERNEREKTKYEIRSGRSTDRESSENEEDYDVHFDDSSAVVYGSQGLWQLLRSANKGLPGRVTVHHEPISYGRSISQDRSESKFETNWKRCGSRASSGYNTGTRSQSRDRTESPREKVLRFVFESPRESLSRESNIRESPIRNEKWTMKRSLSRHNPRRDSGVGSDGYESEYSVRPSPSDEFSRTGRVSSMSSICSAAKQDMIRNFMKSWSKEFISPPLSPTSVGSSKDQFENLSENRKHRVEQWLHMNSESPYDFYSDSPSGMSSRKSSTSHGSSAYATMRPREYLQYNRSTSDKLPDSETNYFTSFQEGPRMRSHSLNKDSSGECNKIHLRTAAYSPVSEESSKDTSVHRSDSSHSGSSVHRINFTFSDGRVSSSQTTAPKHIRHFSGPKNVAESPSPTNVKFEQLSRSGQPVVQMRVSFNRGNQENQVIHVTSHSAQGSKGLWEQKEPEMHDSTNLKPNRPDFASSMPRNASPVPGIRQFSTEVQHSVGCSGDPSPSVEYEIINAGNKSPCNTQTGKTAFVKNNPLPFESSIWDMACSQTCMENINMNVSQKVKSDNFNFIANNSINNCLKVLNPVQNECKVNHGTNFDNQSISNGANTPDSLEDLSIEQSLSELSEPAVSDVSPVKLHEPISNVKQKNEFQLEVKPLGALWNSCDTQTSSKFIEQKNDKYLTFAQMQNSSPTSSVSAVSEVPDFQKKCLENTTTEIGSIWNQKNATETFDLLKNLLSNDGLDSFSSSKCVLTSDYKINPNPPQNFVPISDNSIEKQSLSDRDIAVIDNNDIEQSNHNDKFHKIMPSLMDDLQSPKEVLRQAMKICESFERFE